VAQVMNLAVLGGALVYLLHVTRREKESGYWRWTRNKPMHGRCPRDACPASLQGQKLEVDKAPGLPK